MEYMVLEAGKKEELTALVQTYINQGWKPQGGVSVGLSEGYDYAYYAMAQAMVKE